MYVCVAENGELLVFFFRFFPQAYMKIFEKCAKTGDMGTLGGGWGC